MLIIDEVCTSTQEVVGIEITLDDKAFFISLNQALWPGIRIGEFPRSSGKPFLKYGRIALDTISDGETENEAPNP